ncbi:MAG: TraR/DksA family transcriptional regulator [Acidobacteriota bacterium]
MHRRERRETQLYRRHLENLRWVLTREYWRDRHGSLAHAQADPEDFVDLAVRTYTRDFLLCLSEFERNRLFMIEKALARIQEGTYGTCAECGASIPRRRLAAVPWTTLCIDCQVASEETERARASAALEETADEGRSAA